MLFSTKTVAAAAAIFAQGVYAQTPQVNAESDSACSNGGTVFNVYAPVNANNIGPLNIDITVDLSSPCNAGTALGVPQGAAGFKVTNVDGTLGGSLNPAAGGAITLSNSGTIADNCFYPCSGNNLVDDAGISFSQANAASGTPTTYRFNYNAGYSVMSSQNAADGTGVVFVNANIDTSESCVAPSPALGFCAADESCASTQYSFSTVTAQDTNNVQLTANIRFSKSEKCNAPGGVGVSQSSQGYLIDEVSGTYQGLPIEFADAGADGTTDCFYPCDNNELDIGGFEIQTQPRGATGVVYRIFLSTPATATTPAVYSVTQENGVGSPATLLLKNTVFAQSCLSTQNAYYNTCPNLSSSSSLMSSTSTSSSLPTISIPTTSSTSSISSAATSSSSTSSSTAASVPVTTSSSSSLVVITTPLSSTTSATAAATTPVSASTTGPVVSVATPFIIAVNVEVAPLRKRQVVAAQAVEYIGVGGVLTASAADAATFQLINGQLFSENQIVSTGPEIPAQQPLAGGAQGTVTTVWSATAGAVEWTNAVFANGAASFCILNNVVNTVFVAAPVGGCVPVTLTTAPVSNLIATPANAAGANGIIINNNVNPVIGVYVTVNLVLGTDTLSNGSVITTTGLSSSTCPLYASATNGGPCVPCALAAMGSSCPSSGVTLYSTGCSKCEAFSTPAAVAVTCPTCAPVAVGAVATAGADSGSAAAAAAAAAAAVGAGAASATGAASAEAGQSVFVGAASSFGIPGAAMLVAGAALLL